jgi:hypothetical protein
MLQRWNIILNYVIGSFTGVFIGYSIYKYFDYANHSDLYTIQSAPWYIGIQIRGIATAVIISIAFIPKFLLKKKMKNI